MTDGVDATAANTPLTNDGKHDCTSDCTHGSTAVNSAAPPERRRAHIAEALVVIARLPLTDAEKAEAVRRLLASSGIERNP